MTTMTTTSTDTTPRVWVGCLACYNAGRLVGDWHDASDADEVTYSCSRPPLPAPVPLRKSNGDHLKCQTCSSFIVIHKCWQSA